MTRSTFLSLILLAACGDFPALPPLGDAADPDGQEPDAATADATDAAVPVDGPVTCNGLRVVIADGTSPGQDVFTVMPDGMGRTPLAPHPMTDFAVSGAPQGYAAFTTNRDGNNEIYRVNYDGTGLVNLTMSPTSEGAPVFSPNGAMIAYTGGSSLRVMNADGTNPRAVAAGNSYGPRWSRDNTKLAFTIVGSPAIEQDIWVVNADGTGLRQITSLAGAEGGPSWSADGTKIAFSHAGDIHVVNAADGSGRVNLTNDSGTQYSPAYTLDGSRLAFSDDGDIKSMPAAGGARTPISSGADTDNFPIFSPDGSKILFQRYVSGSVHVVIAANADGTAPAQIAGPQNYVGSVDWVGCP